MNRLQISLMLATNFVGVKAVLAAPSAILTRVQGHVEVHRGAQKLAGRDGLALQNGDKISVQGGSATIFSLSGPPKTVQNGSAVVGTAASKTGSPALWQGIYNGLSRGLNRGDRRAALTMRPGEIIPLFPFHSLIETSRPRFEWRPGALNAARYEITVLNAKNQLVWRAQTEKTALDYPSNAPALSGSLFWKVTPLRQENGAWQPITGWTSRTVPFQIAATQLNAVRVQLAALDGQMKAAPKIDRVLARAALWSAQGFSANALQELEAAGSDATAQAMQRALWLETGQNWRLETQPKLAEEPLGSAEAKLLAWNATSPLPIENRKTYVAPDGHFSLQIPARFAAGMALLPRKVTFYQLAATPTSPNQLCIACASPADFPLDGSLIDFIAQLSAQNTDFRVEKRTPANFRSQKALQGQWRVTLNKIGCNGAMIEWREGGLVWLASYGGEVSQASALEPLLSTLQIGTKVPMPKTDTPDALLKIFDASVEASLEAMRQINERQRIWTSEAPPAIHETPSIADFDTLDKVRLAAPANSHERALAALNASRLASRLAWNAYEKGEIEATKRWFLVRAELSGESYRAEMAALQAELKDDDLKIGQFSNLTPPLAVAPTYAQATEMLFSVKAMHLGQWNLLALIKGDMANLQRAYTELLALHRITLAAARLSDSTSTTSLEGQAAIASDFDNLAYAAQKRADLAGARAYYSHALEWRRSLPPNDLRQRLQETLRFRGDLEAELGDNRLARDFFEQSIAEFDRTQAWHDHEVETQTNEELRLWQRTQWAQTRAILFNNLALVVWTLGDYKATESYLNKALQTIEPLPADGSAGEVRASMRATTLNNFAMFYDYTGDLDKADALLRQSIELRRTLGEDVTAAKALLNSAGIDLERGLTDAALTKATTASALLTPSENPTEWVNVNLFMAALQFKSKNFAQALDLANEALALARTLGNTALISETARMVASLRLENAGTPLTEEVKTATAALIDEAARANAGAGDLLSEIDTLSLRADWQEKNGDLNGALATLQGAIARNERVRATTSADTNFAEVKSNYRLYDHAVHLLLKLNQPNEAFDMLGRARSKKLVDDLHLSALKSNDAALQTLLDRAAALDQKLAKTRGQLSAELSQAALQRDKVKIDNLRDLIASTQQEFFDVSAQIKAKNPRFEKALSLSPRELKKAQRAIPEGTLLLQYAVLDDGLYIFAVTRDSLKIYQPKASRANLDQAVRAYRGAIDADIAGLQAGQNVISIDEDTPLRAASVQLSNWLLAPVQGDIDAAQTVAIIPSGELFYLPFHALGHEENGKWHFLIEEKPIAYLAAGDVLSVATQLDESQTGQGVLALGDPTGANLPATRTEVEAIVRLFPASNALVGANASKETLLLPDSLARHILHLAAHGVLDSAQPDQSFIQLSPSPRDDGKLRVGEIYGLNLNHVDLVTLSACRTALGEGEPDGTEISSLAQSFSTAGTPSVVASLWNVEDNSTAHLMEAFYSALAAGNSKGMALQKAQIAVLSDPKTRHPVFWAPFELLGDWR